MTRDQMNYEAHRINVENWLRGKPEKSEEEIQMVLDRVYGQGSLNGTESILPPTEKHD